MKEQTFNLSTAIDPVILSDKSLENRFQNQNKTSFRITDLIVVLSLIAS
jgi:hypothetical protein